MSLCKCTAQEQKDLCKCPEKERGNKTSKMYGGGGQLDGYFSVAV